MQTPQIVAYLKTHCGWSRGVRTVLAKYNLPFTEKDIIQHPEFRSEMEQRTGQTLSPCVEINGTMLPDISGEEVEQFMISKGLVHPNESTPDVPINAGCSDAEHAAQLGVDLRFR
jgi:monothiol glutaredoxin